MATTINGSAGVVTNSGAVYDGIQSGTAVTASGTQVNFTGIPSWVKRITVMFSGVSTNGSSNVQIQLGAGSVTTSGYVGTSDNYATSGSATAFTTGLALERTTASNSVRHGIATFCTLGSNAWVGNYTGSSSTFVTVALGATSIALGGTLDRIRITTVNGTDTFDAGTINILYE
jgi:hypothetical protein